MPASIIVLITVFLGSKRRFQLDFWNEVKTFFCIRSDDIKEEAKSRAAAAAAEKPVAGKRYFLVAEIKGMVAGTAAVRPAPGMDPVARACKLYWLSVHPACRRLGIGSRLIDDALSLAARDGGYMRAAASVSKTNAAATGALERAGFRLVEEAVLVSSYPLKFRVADYEMDLDYTM